MKRSLWLLALSAAFCSITSIARADGELDTSYCHNGSGRIGFGVPYRKASGSTRHTENVVKKALPTADGGVIYVYESTVVDFPSSRTVSMPIVMKLNSSCQLDLNFGMIDPSLDLGGSSSADLQGTTLLGQLSANQEVYVRGAAQSSDGHIVLGIQTGNVSEVVWLNAKGSIDGGFGNRSGDFELPGITYLPHNFRIADIAILPDDSVVLGGTYHSATDETAIAAMKLSAKGLIDASFAPWDINHIAHTPIGADYSLRGYGTAVAIQPATRNIVVVGSINNDVAIVNFSDTGALNTRFNFNSGFPGIKTFSFDQCTVDVNSLDLSYAVDVVVQSDEKIVVAGSIGGDPKRCSDKRKLIRKIGVARVNMDGSFDGWFGTGGKMQFSYQPGGSNAPNAMVLQNASILVSGSSNGGQYAGVARINSNGDLDRSFGVTGTGVGLYNLCANNNFGVYALALQQSKPVIGISCMQPNYDSTSGLTYVARLQQTVEPPPIVAPPVEF